MAVQLIEYQERVEAWRAFLDKMGRGNVDQISVLINVTLLKLCSTNLDCQGWELLCFIGAGGIGAFMQQVRILACVFLLDELGFDENRFNSVQIIDIVCVPVNMYFPPCDLN